jgi:plasmid stabilization system protein ParE
MNVSWSKLAREKYYDVLEYLFDNFGENAAIKLENAVLKVEDNLKSGLVKYPMSKKLGIRKCVVLKHNLLLYMEIGQEVEIVAFISSSENHQY